MASTATSELRFDPEELASVAHEFGLRLVVLFGSHARRNPPPGPASDVDVALLGCDGKRFWKCHKALSEALSTYDLDLVRMEDADPLFRHEILSVGRLLWGNPDLFFEYRAFAFRDFVDSADLRRLEHALFRRKMAWIGKQLDAPG
ncbi:MAG: nucleotidyltransferase domain-containing protein [Thioalkalivibrio sp.]|nr:MAG: nucleotidyltransferase domain-containing protein [Thioalkalivibrio sp.]